MLKTVCCNGNNSKLLNNGYQSEKKPLVYAMSVLCVTCVCMRRDLSSRVRTHTISCVRSSVFLEELINIQQEAE